MGYTGTMFVLFPPTFLLMAAILLAISFASIYIMKRLVKLSKQEIINEKGTLMSLIFTIWGINVAALSVSFVIMDLITLYNPFFNNIHSEWARSIPHSYMPEIAYICILSVLHSVLLLFGYLAIIKWIACKPKRFRIFIGYVTSSVLLWALFMCFGFGII